MSLRVKNKSHFAFSATKPEPQHWLELSGLWRQLTPPLGILHQSIWQVVWKVGRLEWNLEHERVLQQVQALMLTSLVQQGSGKITIGRLETGTHMGPVLGHLRVAPGVRKGGPVSASAEAAPHPG